MTPEQFDALSTAIANISCAGGSGGGGGIALDDSRGVLSDISVVIEPGQTYSVYEMPCDCVIDSMVNMAAGTSGSPVYIFMDGQPSKILGWLGTPNSDMPSIATIRSKYPG